MSIFDYIFDSEWSQRSDIKALEEQISSLTSGLSHKRFSEVEPEDRVTELEQEIGELALLTKTLMRMLLEKGVCTGKEIQDMMHQVDLEDGAADGRVTKSAEAVAGRCPECDHLVQSRRERCLYCGHEFPDVEEGTPDAEGGLIDKAVEEGPDDDETQQPAERASAQVESSPSPQAQSASLDMKAVCEELFTSSMMTVETNRMFEDKYQGTTITWSGILQRADRCSHDMVFGSEPCTKAVFETHELAEGVYAARKVQAVVQLPLDVLDELRSRVGEEVPFEGTLTSCDTFMRNLFLKNGHLRTMGVSLHLS